MLYCRRCKACAKVDAQKPEKVAKRRERARSEDAKAKNKEWRRRTNQAAKQAAYVQRPEVKARRKERANSPHGKLIGRKSSLKRKFGLTLEDYDRMLAEQNGHCALCPSTVGNSRRRNLHIDHDHETNEVRRLLCSRCNTAIGLLEEDVGLLSRMVAYLQTEDWRIEVASSYLFAGEGNISGGECVNDVVVGIVEPGELKDLGKKSA